MARSLSCWFLRSFTIRIPFPSKLPSAEGLKSHAGFTARQITNCRLFLVDRFYFIVLGTRFTTKRTPRNKQPIVSSESDLCKEIGLTGHEHRLFRIAGGVQPELCSAEMTVVGAVGAEPAVHELVHLFTGEWDQPEAMRQEFVTQHLERSISSSEAALPGVGSPSCCFRTRLDRLRG